MTWYKELHAKGEDAIIAKHNAAGEEAWREFRKDGCIFDVYVPERDLAYEVLTAKWARSAHEQDEAIIAKLFRYLLHCSAVRLVLVSYDHEDLDYLHAMRIEHVHREYSWATGRLLREVRHHGKRPKTVLLAVLRWMARFAPLKEWYDPKRRKRHPRGQHRELFARISERFGLPGNFLYGIWRDWRLAWVWHLEQDLPEWQRRLKRLSKP
jgi:hypothetical protein